MSNSTNINKSAVNTTGRPRKHIEPSKPWPRPEAKIDTGGPAYPQYAIIKGQMTGMTLRDYFAGQALVGILSNASIELFRRDFLDGKVSEKIQTKIISEICAEYADAMIEARRG